MFKHGQLFILENRSMNVWSEQSLRAGPGLPAYRTGEYISLPGPRSYFALCSLHGGGLCYQDPPSLISPVFPMVPSGILAWIFARVGITAWDAEFEPKTPAWNHEL